MKNKKIKICILFIFILLILVETISIGAYEVSKKNNRDELINKIESKEVKLSTEERETLDLINEYRVQNGLTELKPYYDLYNVAKLKAEDLEQNNYFEHQSPNLGTPFEMLRNNKIQYQIAGENLAGNTTPARAVNAWINSKTHRENILEERFQYTGIYVVDSQIYGKIFVQLFIGV